MFNCFELLQGSKIFQRTVTMFTS